MAELNGNGSKAALYERLALSTQLMVWSRVASILGALVAGPGILAVGWFALATIENGKNIARHEERLNQLSQRADQIDHRVDGIESRIDRQFDRTSATSPR